MEIIAEIGTSHGGNIEKAKKLIDASVESGATYIKFQWVYADEILHPETGFVTLPGGKIRLYDRFRELEVPKEFFQECLEYTHSLGAKFLCSPFGTKSLSELIEIKPDAIKIASPELNHTEMLKQLAEFRKTQKNPTKIIISSGVSKLSDIERAIEILGKENLTLLHCVTFYPAPEEEYNLNVIPNLSKILGIDVGVSDHSMDPVLVPSLSVAVGATMIEKHITLSRKTDGLDDPVALEEEQFAFMSHCIRQCEAIFRQYKNPREYIIKQMEDQYGDKVRKCLGDGVKKLSVSESVNYGRTNRSLHYLKDLKAGEIARRCDIGILRTEKILSPGIHPDFIEIVSGKRLAKDVKSGEGLMFEHFMQ